MEVWNCILRWRLLLLRGQVIFELLLSLVLYLAYSTVVMILRSYMSRGR
jgi:predicted membrane chloride channel (bestrophin family)